MSGTANPSSSVTFGDGNSATVPDLGTSSVVMIGPASGGPRLKPRRVSSLDAVLAFLHGPVVGQASHHVTYSQPAYMMRSNASTPGTVGAVTKVPVASSLGTMSVTETEATIHASATGGAPLNLNSGWTLPPAPLPLLVTVHTGTVAHTITVQYKDEAGIVQTETITVLSGAGEYNTVGFVSQVISLTTNIDPVGAQDYQVVFSGPQDRYHVLWSFLQGGQLSGTKPLKGQWSADNGRTWSPTLTVTAGGVDLYSYAGGKTPQATGLSLVFSSGAATYGEYGTIAVAGADINGELVFTALTNGVTVATVAPSATQTLNFVVTGKAIVINPGSTGTVINTTAAQLIAYLQTSTDAGAKAARALIRARGIVGTGNGLLAAQSATGTVNGDITWTSLQENVQLTVLESGVSQVRKVQVSGTNVTIYLDTDSNGVRSSTAAQIVALVAANSAAQLLLTGVAGGSGAGVAGDTQYAVTLPSQFNTGDEFSFDATPPTMSNGDIIEALTTLQSRSDVLDNNTIICLVKDGATDADFVSLHTFLDSFGNTNKQYMRGIISGSFMGSQDQTQWATNEIAAHPTRGTKVSIVEGEIDTVIPAYGSQNRRNFAILYVARLMNCPISEFPSHTTCDTLIGTQYSLPGVGSHVIPGSDPNAPEYTSLYQTDDTLITLHSQNMVTPRELPKLSGIFVRQAVQYTNDGDDWIFLPIARVADAGAALAYIDTVKMLNADLLTDPSSGMLAEIEHQKIEAHVASYVGAELLDDNGRQHVSALQVISDREINFAETGEVVLTLNFVGKNPAITFSTSINVVQTLQAVPQANG